MYLVSTRKFRQTKCLGLAVSLLALTASSAWTYERDVHYDLTRYLAIWAGFSKEDAQEIAKSNQGLDDNPATSAVPDCKRMFGYECRSVA